ncbi:MAG: hypothetical protein KBF88_11885, partial [Polyangiaceae bacterium]|nr:hypothetical protein [Polyangiaceae bacterium]
LGACVGRVVDECFADECSDFYAGLVLGDYGPITIAPGKSVTLYVGGDVLTKQPYILNVRTDSLK